MYRIGWGFHAELEQLAAAALIWQRGIKPLRLVRQRHLARLRSGEDSVNLASLPLELMSIIEDDIYDFSYASLKQKEPFFFACDCDAFLEGLYNWQPFYNAQTAYAEQYANNEAGLVCPGCGGHHEDEGLFEEGLHRFGKTDRYQELRQEYMAIHLADGYCETEDRKQDAWLHILATSEAADEGIRSKQAITEVLSAIHAFETDFGLVRLLPATISTGRLRKQAFQFSSKVTVGSVVHMFKLAACVNASGDAQGVNLSWITAYLKVEEPEEIEVDCKTVEEVEKHNARLMKKRKTKAKRSKSERQESRDTRTADASRKALDATRTA